MKTAVIYVHVSRKDEEGEGHADLIFKRAKNQNWSALADDFRTFLLAFKSVWNT